VPRRPVAPLFPYTTLFRTYFNCIVVIQVLSPSKVDIFASVVRLPCVISTTNVSSLGNHISINPFFSVVIVSSTTTSPDESVTNTSKSSSTNSHLHTGKLCTAHSCVSLINGAIDTKNSSSGNS